MTICVTDESTEPISVFSSPRPVKDVGCFTLQQADVPLAARLVSRRKAGGRRRNARLTPISEAEESDFDFFFDADTSYPNINEEDICRSEGTSSRLGFHDDGKDDLTCRSDTPTILLGSPMTLSRELETLIEEENEASNASNLDSDKHKGRVVVPKLKFKRKALPLQTERGQKVAKTRRSKLLTHRPRLNEDEKQRMIEHERKHRRMICEMAQLSDAALRPRSAETNRLTAKLPSLLDSAKFSSVPDLPAVLNKVSKNGFVKDDILLSKSRNSSPVKDSTDSENVSEGNVSSFSSSPTTVSEKKEPRLTGSNMSLFYNMWDWEKHRRPLERRNFDKTDTSLIRRGCSCLKKSIPPHHQCPRKAHNGITLPPL